MPLLETPNVKNSHILTKKNFAFLKKKKNVVHQRKSFNTKFRHP